MRYIVKRVKGLSYVYDKASKEFVSGGYPLSFGAEKEALRLNAKDIENRI